MLNLFISRILASSVDFLCNRVLSNGSPIISRSRASDDKEKCCLESRSWLNLGHHDDGACTFSTILLYSFSPLCLVFVPHCSIQHLFSPSYSLSLSTSFSLSVLLASSSFTIFLSLYSFSILLFFSSVCYLSLFSSITIVSFSPFCLFFSLSDTIQGSSFGGRPDANRWRAKK